MVISRNNCYNEQKLGKVKNEMENKVIAERQKRIQWHTQARFGMFIHWGLYAVSANGEWIRSIEELPKEDYEGFIDDFHAEDYDPKEWAKLAKQAGMKYAVLTAKHHDGFCLWDSAYTDFKSTNAPCKRDLVREFLEAFRAVGIKVGLYFSVIDWRHADYPHYGDKFHPMRNNKEFKNVVHDFDNYLTFMHNQVRELVTNYGHLDIMWFDFSYDDMKNEKWQAEELMEMIRSVHPNIITDNRLEGSAEDHGSIGTTNPTAYAGDFASPEQMIPPQGLLNEIGEPIPWEANMTLNNNWGYAAHDKRYKSAKLVIRTLVECISKNGNMLLNVGPDAKGRIPKESIQILEEVGEWMKDNGRSIYGCGLSEFPKPEWGRFTQNGNKVYAHVLEEQVGAICLPNMVDKIEKLRLLKDNSVIKETKFWNLAEYTKENAFFFFDSNAICSYPLPDERDTVVEITLKSS